MPDKPATRDALIEALNKDLSREYQAIIAYVVYSQALKGAQYMTIAKELEKHASEELRHALTISKHIDYLGGMPNGTALPVKLSEKGNPASGTGASARSRDRARGRRPRCLEASQVAHAHRSRARSGGRQWIRNNLSCRASAHRILPSAPTIASSSCAILTRCPLHSGTGVVA